MATAAPALALGEVMDQLRALGTAQAAKIYRRHGAGERVFGVSYADLGKLAKRIKQDQALARQLWTTGNYDARNLAGMIASPSLMSQAELDSWADEADCRAHADVVAGLASKMTSAWQIAQRWIGGSEEWTCYAGWNLAAMLAQTDAEHPDSVFTALLDRIERDIHGSRNWVRHAMNNALIAIGIRNRTLEAAARQAAQRIGRVEVDHGLTNCKTPEALSYMERAWARRANERGR